MYLRRICIRNSGPVASLDLELPFHANGLPIPQVFIGSNGSGKTNVLSIVADALFEGAAGVYEDVLQGSAGLIRRWFRVVGSKTTTHGAQGGFSILRFTDGHHNFLYKEKGGSFPASQAQKIAPEDLKPAAQWEDDGSVKEFTMPEAEARRIFTTGAYAYFPSSRAEYPYWLNREALPEDRFETATRLASKLGKPLFVEQGVENFAQWLLSVIVEARVDVTTVQNISMQSPGFAIGPAGAVNNFAQKVQSAAEGLATFQLANQILRIIMHDPQARFVWGGRRHSQKIAIEAGDRIVAPGLDGLSGGQASLLTIFGTLLRYGDSHRVTSDLNSAEIEGICIIDEVDAHMHVDLQLEALPQLIALFPRVQFLISGHSPLFAMGMEKHLTGSGVRFVEMPTGAAVSAEAYREFQNALNAFKNTRAFDQAVQDAALASGRPKVWLEGETDPMYFVAAAEALEFTDLLNSADFEWIGAKNPQSGQGFNTGKDSLDKAWSLLSAKPSLAPYKVVLLYDADTGKGADDAGNVHKRVLPFNEGNSVAKKGIENLLPESVFTDDVYDTETRDRDYGGSVTTRTINKMRLCQKLCAAKDAGTFENFRAPLEEIRALILGTLGSA